MTEVPLIYTTKGNVPIDTLESANEWEDTETYTKFIEIYKLNGEVVRQAAHVMMKNGQQMESFNGEHTGNT